MINALKELLDIYGENKFAFGTYSPFLDYLTGRLRIEALREDEANEETKDFIRCGNAKRILGIN